MAALGDRPAAEVSTREVEQVLKTIAATGVAPRTVNGAREIMGAAFTFGMKSTSFLVADQSGARYRPPPCPSAARSGLLFA
jgi:hypothetical protein